MITGRLKNALLATALLACTNCGGDSGSSGPTPVSVPPGPSPTPGPTASPTPQPPAFEPVLGSLFEDPSYNENIVVLGKGYSFDHQTNWVGPWEVVNAADADDFSISFDQATGGYRVSASLAGTGMLYRVSDIEVSNFPDTVVKSYAAVIADDTSDARGVPSELSITQGAAGNRFQYVSIAVPWVHLERDSTTSSAYFGTFGVAQPTLSNEKPSNGTANYSGFLYGFFNEDAGATGLYGTVELSVDYATKSVSGELTTEFWCFMGCGYPPQTYDLTAAQSHSDSDLSGEIVKSGLPSAGQFDGVFAGQQADEILMRAEFPYFNHDLNRWMMFGGIIVAKRI